MDDHGVNFFDRKLKFEAGKSVGEGEGHVLEFFLIETFNEVGHIESELKKVPDASEHFFDGFGSLTFNAQFFGNLLS